MNADNATTFTGHFSSVLDRIEKLESPLFQKILTIGILDTFGRAAFPGIKGNHKRFIAFIETCSGWADRDVVSAQQLSLKLESVGISTGNLHRLADSTVRSWDDGSFVEPKDDLSLSQTMQACTQKQEEKCVQESTYKELFYEFRNHLVHEFREPGYGFDFAKHGVPMKGRDFPYYHGLVGEPWQFVFPDAFFKKLSRDSHAGLRDFLIQNGIDPYESIPPGSLWKKGFQGNGR